jgi:outer membrane protein TolC
MNNKKTGSMKCRVNGLIGILLAALALPAVSFSQSDTLYLTLKDAISIAQQQSPDALMAKHRFRMSYWQYRSFSAEYRPGINLQAIMPNISNSFRKVSVPDGPDIYQYNSLSNYSVQMSIDQKIGWTGGSVFLESRLERLDNIYPDSTTTSYQTTPVVIGYRQPIFQYNEYRWAKKLEPLKYEKAKRQYMEDNEMVAQTANNHFFNLLTASIEKGIAVKNMANYDTLYHIAKGRYQLGKIAENDLLQLELNYLKASAAVDNANLRYENMLFRMRSYLRIKDRELVLIPPAETSHPVISAADAIANARKNTAVSLEFEERMLSAQSSLNQAKMDGRFDADLYLEYGLTQSAELFTDSYKDPKDQQQLNLGISLPILDWGVARGKIRVAESNLDLEQTAVDQDLIDFEQNVFLSVMQFNMQKGQLKIAAKADTVAQKRFDVTQKRYMIGQVNDVLELNNAQIDNDNAKMGYYEALRSYWDNYYELRRLTLYDYINEQMLIFDIRDIM